MLMEAMECLICNPPSVCRAPVPGASGLLVNGGAVSWTMQCLTGSDHRYFWSFGCF